MDTPRADSKQCETNHERECKDSPGRIVARQYDSDKMDDRDDGLPQRAPPLRADEGIDDLTATANDRQDVENQHVSQREAEGHAEPDDTREGG